MFSGTSLFTWTCMQINSDMSDYNTNVMNKFTIYIIFINNRDCNVDSTTVMSSVVLPVSCHTTGDPGSG